MTAVDTALQSLRAALDRGDHPPGARLPAERILAQALNVGRGTLRKALNTLAREGRIRRRVGEGTFVCDAPAALLRFAAPPTPADIMEARRMLEPAIAATAALRARPDDVTALRALTAAAPDDDWRAWETRDTAFHAAVAAAARNPLLSAMLDTLHEMRAGADWARLRRRTVTAVHRRAHARQHAAIAEAVAAHDPADAAAAMRAHLIDVEAAMAASDPAFDPPESSPANQGAAG